MTIFKKAIPRKTFLRCLGASIALPLLDAMIPAFALPAETAAKAPVRLGIVYVPNGMWPMEKWTPKVEGAAFELTPTLAPLEPFRDQLLVLTGLAQTAGFLRSGDAGTPHENAFATWLTGVRPKQTAGRDIHAGISMDQIVAQKLGKYTQLASLELSLFVSDLVGVCEAGDTCTYVNALSWRDPTTPLPMERNPRAVFERLFGDSDSTGRAQRLSVIQENRSILDSVSESAARLMKAISPSDRSKLAQYLDAIRDVERRIQLAEEQANWAVPSLNRPAGVPASFDEYAKLMIDLQVLAFQMDLTRVITFVIGREGPFGSRPYPEIGVSDMHHTISHHQNNNTAIEKLFRINVYHAKLFAHLLEKMRSTRDGDGSLLDHSLLLYGSGMSNGNAHQLDNLPLLLAGGARGQMKGGRHLRYKDQTSMTNLHLTVLDKLGLPTEKFGDSTGKLDLLSV